VALENNHIRDYGANAEAYTKETLTKHGIDYTDRYTLAVRTVRGLRFGFLAFNGVGERIDRQSMTSAIRQANSQVDVLVVSFHWGKEYVSLPQADPWLAPDDPVEIAHLAVDAGADLIIGNHPHWVQAVELYKEKLIAYAHGNFIFDQMWSPEVRQGVVGRYTFYDKRLVQVEYLPVLIENYCQPRFLADREAQVILSAIYQASLNLQNSLQRASE
jgi:poly-gamma-glutamate synthesis protein (capsule biosynthesis protein)